MYINNKRALVYSSTIEAIQPIEGADNICTYQVQSWMVVDKINKYQVGDKVLYFEIDSWVPDTLAPFLSRDKPKVHQGVLGNRLRTVKLKGQVSQGLIMSFSDCKVQAVQEDFVDFTEVLGVIKWELPEEKTPANPKGNFPHFIRKTDQENIQNIRRTVENLMNTGKIQKDDTWYIQEKLEGSSMTVFWKSDNLDKEGNPTPYGVCSRNLQLKTDESNTFVDTAKLYYLEENLKNLSLNIAIQGELVGPDIQGNIYGLTKFQWVVFDIFCIDTQKYLAPEEVKDICDVLGLSHVPTYGTIKGSVIDPTVNNELWFIAEGLTKFGNNPNQLQEGIVVKHQSGEFSFKIRSNKYLLKQK